MKLKSKLNELYVKVVDKNEKKRFSRRRLEKNVKKRETAMLKKRVITSVLSFYLSTYISRLKPSISLYILRKYCRFSLDILRNTWKEYVDMYQENALVKAFFYHSDSMLKKRVITRNRLKSDWFSEKFLHFHVSLESLHSIFLILYVPIAFLLKNKFFKMLNFFLIRNNLFKILNFFLNVVVSPPLRYLYVCFLDVGRRANSKITFFKFSQKSFSSFGERFLRVACRMVSSFVCVAFSFFYSYFFFS